MAAMAATNIQQILTSRSIKFIVGKKGTCYTVHEAALDKLCSYGSFASRLTQQKGVQFHRNSVIVDKSPKLFDTVVWRGMDEDVFVRLLEYAYQGDYSVPALTKLDDEKSCGHDATSLDYHLENDGDRFPNVASFIYHLGKEFQQQGMKPFSHPNQVASEAFIDDIKQSDRTGHYEVFICHTKLYYVALEFSWSRRSQQRETSEEPPLFPALRVHNWRFLPSGRFRQR